MPREEVQGESWLEAACGAGCRGRVGTVWACRDPGLENAVAFVVLRGGDKHWTSAQKPGLRWILEKRSLCSQTLKMNHRTMASNHVSCMLPSAGLAGAPAG